MEGSLLDRGIGWYLTVEELAQEEPGFLETGNAGNWIGLGLTSLYVISPIDIIPDFVPGIGVMDDLAVMKFGWLMGGFFYDLLT